MTSRTVLAVMCAGMFLVLLDVTAVNVALPDIADSFGAGVPTLQRVVDGYAVAIACLLLASGALGDRIGHRRVLLAGFALFGLASLACAAAPAPGVLIGGRVVQGVGGALLLPSTMAVIATVFPDKAAQARAFGAWAAVSSLALPAGPLLGGLATAALGWRTVFWVNVPITAVAVVASLLVVPRVPVARRHGPTLPLLCRRAFLAPNVVALTMNLVFNGMLFVTMLYLQHVRHYSPVVAGLVVLPLAVPLVVLAPVSGRLTAARGPRTAVALGCAVAAVGALPLTRLGTSSGTGWLLAGFAILGCGAGLVTASVVAAAVRAMPADRAGLATGVSNTARQIGTASGVAIFGAVAGPAGSAAFVGGLHRLALLAALLWLGALGITVVGIDRS